MDYARPKNTISDTIAARNSDNILNLNIVRKAMNQFFSEYHVKLSYTDSEALNQVQFSLLHEIDLLKCIVSIMK